MNTPSPFESNPDRTNALDRETSLEMLQEQHLNLKLNVEKLESRVTQLRGLLQTLVVGLVIAVLLAIGISGWFAYRLLLQEQIAQRESQQSAAENAEILEQIEEMEAQLQRQRKQLETFREEVPQELETLTNTVQANQRQLQLLRSRLEQVEPQSTSRESSDR
ncbi:MAG: hypothetical protein SAL07_16450 [Oscillatoria sp. PMC 1051.18]|nr:hypothetical protein [Oscillatoria sp. PMC 1050.18]MEC5031490.1 hypothetical protein [Oscillatoria sp. PMC 1051.18]